MNKRTLERAIAVASFVTAVALAFLSLFISDTHEIASGNLMGIAQFLCLTATILGIDYKFYGTESNSRDTQQKPL